MKKINLMTYLYLIGFAVLTRIIPHPWNATAIGAIALFSGREIKHPVLAYVIPLAALFASDLILGFHSTMLFVYAAVALTVWMGQGLGSKYSGILFGSIASSVSFFVITNFGVWFSANLYPMTSQGFLNCYAMAWPFFRSQWVGDFIYVAAIFGCYELLRKLAQSKVSI